MTEHGEYGPPRTTEALRAMAHPARLRLYELLLVHGRQTVSGLANRAELPPGSVSHHLRQLHRAGLVRDAGDLGGDRRRRWWVAVPGGLRWSPGDFRTAFAAEAQAERRVSRLARWQRTARAWPEEWRRAAVGTDTVLRLRPRELAAMEEELREVVSRWEQRSRATPEATTGDPEAGRERRTVFVFRYAFPLPEGADGADTSTEGAQEHVPGPRPADQAADAD